MSIKFITQQLYHVIVLQDTIELTESVFNVSMANIMIKDLKYADPDVKSMKITFI
jgi:hypothetical protein